MPGRTAIDPPHPRPLPSIRRQPAVERCDLMASLAEVKPKCGPQVAVSLE